MNNSTSSKNTNKAQDSQVSMGSFIVSAFFIIVGIVTLYDTMSYSDIDSKVFPRAAAIVLIICASASLIYGFIKPTAEEGFGRGSWWRRVLLVATMLISCFAMPYLGFLAASAIAFVGGLIAAMHDQWTKKKLLLYWGSGAFIMVGFYILFKVVLQVPLP
ncbi:MAG: tripartite tricarboxylate transporter TctB family protein [Cocleimonas sp.]